MKPKPWETKKKPVENISQIIQSNPTVKQQIPKLPPSQISSVAGPLNTTIGATTGTGVTTTTTSGTIGTTGYNGMSGYGGYGSSYGGYGGYGSSYGGYGGYGGGYGMGMGMYGMNRYGMMGGQDQQKGFLFNTMMTLDSFSYLINCLCQIAGSLDRNAEGLSLFYKSFKNLIGRMQNGVINGFKWVFTKIKNFFVAIFQFVVENLFFMGQKQNKSKYRAIKFIIGLAVVLFSISLYPLIRKGIKDI